MDPRENCATAAGAGGYGDEEVKTVKRVAPKELHVAISSSPPSSPPGLEIPVASLTLNQDVPPPAPANGFGGATVSPLSAKDLGKQIAVAEMAHKISSQALLNMNGSRFMRNIAQLELHQNEDPLDESLRDLLSVRSLLHNDPLHAKGKHGRRERYGSLGVVVEDDKAGGVAPLTLNGEFSANSHMPLMSGGMQLDEIPERRAAGLEQMLRDASQTRGIQLTWLIYGIISFVIVIYLLLLVQVQFSVTNKAVRAEEVMVQMSSSAAVNQLEWLHYATSNMLQFSRVAKVDYGDVGTDNLCMTIGGGPLVFATYNIVNTSLTWALRCPMASSLGVHPPLSLDIDREMPPGSIRTAIYKNDFLIAAQIPADRREAFVVILRKEPVGRLLFANSIPTYSASTLKRSSTAFLMPEFSSSELLVAVHSLNMEYTNYTVAQPTKLGRSMQKTFDTVCQSGNAYTWHSVVRPTFDRSIMWKNEADRPANVTPRSYVKYGDFRGSGARVVACGVFCVEPVANRCTAGNPTSTWFIISNEPSTHETEVVLTAITTVSIAAAMLFLFMLTVAYISISVPVKHLRSLIFHALGDKRTKTRREHLLFQYTRCLWLGDLQALVRAFQLLSFCFKLNKKYVPQHILEKQMFELENHKDYLWRRIVDEADGNDDEDVDADGDGDGGGGAVGANREEMETFVNTVSGMDGMAGVSMLNMREALSQPNGGGRGWGESSTHVPPTVDGETGEMSGIIGAVYNIDVVGRGMTIVEGATILSVHLCAVEMAYFNNYRVAVKQHRRIMNLLLGRIRHYRGELFERSGDCIAATWNAFESRTDHACRAASCALSIARLLTSYRQAGFRVGIVLHQGPFVCGVVQDNKEAFTTVFGSVPRQAIALAELAASLPYFDVLVSEPVKQTLSSHYECIMVDVIKYHEDDNPIVMFELSEERLIPPVKGTPLAPSAFAEGHARVFFDFRNHEFERALDGVRQLRTQFPRIGHRLLRRIELLCHYYRHHANELPLPYFRPYPTWSNYEAIANIDAVPDSFANGPRDDVILDLSRLMRLSRSVYEDDALKFRQELHDNMLASRRLNGPGYIVKALEVGDGKDEVDSSAASAWHATNEYHLDPMCMSHLCFTGICEDAQPESAAAAAAVGVVVEMAPEPVMAVVSGVAAAAAAAAAPFRGNTILPAVTETMHAEQEPNGGMDKKLKDWMRVAAPASTAAAEGGAIGAKETGGGSSGGGGGGGGGGGDEKTEAESGEDGGERERERIALAAAAATPTPPTTAIAAAAAAAGGGGGGGGGGPAELESVLSVRTPTEVCTDNNNDDDDDIQKVGFQGPKFDGRQRFSFTNRLAATVMEGRSHSVVCGTESCVSLSSEVLHNAPSISFRDLDGSLAKVAYELPTEIVAKNGITYLRSSRILGKGSFGCVYLGMDVHSGRMVAIKFLPLPSEEEETTNAETEVVTMQKVKSSHVVEFISYAFQSNLIIIIMECMMAGSLQGMLSAFDSIPGATARLFIRDVLRGLHKLHSMGVIHRDVKPQNVLLTLAGNCKISDFGASAFLQELVRKQMEGKGLQVQGTPVYLAPEAARGTPEEKSDIWSCGIMFIQLVKGALPYAKSFLQMPPQVLVYQIGSGAAKPIIPGSLDEFEAEFVRNCLKENPNERLSAQRILELPMFAL